MSPDPSRVSCAARTGKSIGPAVGLHEGGEGIDGPAGRTGGRGAGCPPRTRAPLGRARIAGEGGEGPGLEPRSRSGKWPERRGDASGARGPRRPAPGGWLKARDCAPGERILLLADGPSAFGRTVEDPTDPLGRQVPSRPPGAATTSRVGPSPDAAGFARAFAAGGVTGRGGKRSPLEGSTSGRRPRLRGVGDSGSAGRGGAQAAGPGMAVEAVGEPSDRFERAAELWGLGPQVEQLADQPRQRAGPAGRARLGASGR